MNKPLRVLLLEDSVADAALVLHALRRAGYAPSASRVETEKDFLEQLQSPPEIILADFTMPEFDSLRALEILQQRKVDVPFIIVSGTIGEERAVQIMQHGATDYIIKDRLGRLGPAVTQALDQWRLKKDKVSDDLTIAQLAAIVESSGEAIMSMSLDGLITNWNRAAESLFGYPAADIIGLKMALLLPRTRRQGDASEDLVNDLSQLGRGEHKSAFETVRVRKDGRRIEILLSYSSIRDTNGAVTSVSAIALDITERKRSERYLAAEQAVTLILAESRSLEEAGPKVLQTVADSLRWEVALLWIVDRDADVLRLSSTHSSPWANPGFFQALSQTKVLQRGEGVAGRTWISGVPVWERGITIQQNEARRSATTHEGLRGGFAVPMVRNLETVGVIEFYNPELAEPGKALLASMVNISGQLNRFCERRRTESALEESENSFRQLANAMPQIVWTARPDGKLDYFNERWYQFVGSSRKEDPDTSWHAGLHADDLHRIEQVWLHSVRTGTPLETELRLVEGKTGHSRWFLVRAVAATDAAGTITRWYGTSTDIDDQKKNLEELRASEERFRNLLMALPAAVYTTDRTGIITLCNEHAVELWGRRPELGVDRWCGSWKLLRLDGSALPLDQCPMAVALREGSGIHGEELIIERPDGSRVNVLKHPEVLRGPTGEIIGAANMVIDITQMKQLEDQYRQSHKMEAVGQLAAGVAHDFNNLLTIIMGYSELLLMKLPTADPGREQIGQVLSAGERAASLTRQLLIFARKQILSPVVLDLNILVTEIERMLTRLIGADIEVITNLQPGLPPVKVDPGQIEQILMNLVVNARDAMPTGGRLTIQTSKAELSSQQSRQHPAHQGSPHIIMSVGDTGTGMSDATKTHIFEPFFTTKEVGKGTGLGLATVFGIVQQSGGFIEVDSELGRGTTFKIYFPQSDEAPSLKSISHVQANMPRGKETILVVEDDPNLRKLARVILEANGYKVLSAEHGEEAFQACTEYQDIIHLLCTDVVMPKMGGRQLADLLTPIRPDMKVLFVSGYTDETVVRHGIQEGRMNFLRKPFTPLVLARTIRELLDAPVNLT